MRSDPLIPYNHHCQTQASRVLCVKNQHSMPVSHALHIPSHSEHHKGSVSVVGRWKSLEWIQIPEVLIHLSSVHIPYSYYSIIITTSYVVLGILIPAQAAQLRSGRHFNNRALYISRFIDNLKCRSITCQISILTSICKGELCYNICLQNN